MTRAAVYARKSTFKEGSEILRSVNLQIEGARAWIAKQGGAVLRTRPSLKARERKR